MWIPLKLRYSTHLSYEWVNPHLKLLTSVILQESGVKHFPRQTDSFNFKVSERLCVCWLFNTNRQRIPPLYHLSSIGYSMPRQKKNLYFVLTQFKSGNQNWIHHTSLNSLVINTPIHTKKKKQLNSASSELLGDLNTDCGCTNTTVSMATDDHVVLLFCQTAVSQRRSTDDEVLSLRFNEDAIDI